MQRSQLNGMILESMPTLSMSVDSCIGVWLSYETTATVMSHSAGQGGAADQCNDHNYSSPPWTLEQSPARDTQQTL